MSKHRKHRKSHGHSARTMAWVRSHIGKNRGHRRKGYGKKRAFKYLKETYAKVGNI